MAMGALTFGILGLPRTGDVIGHTVTVADNEGNTGTGTGETYEQASANARHALK
jgi:hypothetical protein